MSSAPYRNHADAMAYENQQLRRQNIALRDRLEKMTLSLYDSPGAKENAALRYRIEELERAAKSQMSPTMAQELLSVRGMCHIALGGVLVGVISSLIHLLIW